MLSSHTLTHATTRVQANKNKTLGEAKPFYFYPLPLRNRRQKLTRTSDGLILADLCATPSGQTRRKPQAYGKLQTITYFKKPAILSAIKSCLSQLLENKILKVFTFLAYSTHRTSHNKHF